MRPEFGCRHPRLRVRARRRRAPPGSIAHEVRASLAPLGAAHRGRGRRRRARRRTTDRCSTSTSATRSSATNDPRNLVFPFYVIPPRTAANRGTPPSGSGDLNHAAPDSEPRRPPLPGPRRRRQAPGPAALPGVDRPQRLRPGRHADRDVRLDDRPAALPAQPRARPQLRQVPRADRGAACSRRRPRYADVTFWLSAPQPRRRPHPGRHAGRDASAPRPTSRSCSPRPRTCRSSRARSPRSRRRWSTARRTATTRGARAGAPTSTCFNDGARGRRRALRRAVRGGPLVRGRPPLQLPTSRASASTPTNPPLAWEAWDGERLGALRGRLRRDRRPQPRRRRRPPRPEGHAASLDHGAAGRLAPLPASRSRRGASPPTAPRRRSRAVSAITIGGTVGGRATPSSSATRYSALRGRPRPAVRARARPRSSVAMSPRARGLESAERLGGVGPRSPTSPAAARRPALPARPGRRRGASSGRRCASRRRTARTIRQYGAVPPKGARLRMRVVPRPAAAARGNVGPESLTVLKSSIPFVSRGREPASRRAAASTARTSRTPRSADRSCCGPAAGR